MKLTLAMVKNHLMRKSLMQRLGYYFADEMRPEKWIFIIGCYNSGTTLLAHLLARHSDIGTLPGEGVAFTDGLLRPEEFGWPRLWIKCREQMEIDVDEPAKLARRIKKQWAWATIGSGSCILEKSIANATRLEFLNDYFKPAYFIHITRNGYAVAEGIRRKAAPRRWHNPDYRDRYPLALCAEQWRVSIDTIEASKDRLERYHSLRYEDLVANPRDELRKILDFTGMPWEQQVVNGNVRVHGASGPIEDMNHKSLQNLDPADKAAVAKVAGDCLARLGYSAEA